MNKELFFLNSILNEYRIFCKKVAIFAELFIVFFLPQLRYFSSATLRDLFGRENNHLFVPLIADILELSERSVGEIADWDSFRYELLTIGRCSNLDGNFVALLVQIQKTLKKFK